MIYDLIGNDPAIRKIRELIGLVSETGLNVLLLGETGTGKEVVARLLHSASDRKGKRFIKVNCAALPLTLLESELFGYEKGAFTGADKFKPGKFELATDGVIYLDEIGDMGLPLQAKLLEVLQSGEFARLGGTDVVKVNAWVIASTNHDLEKDMKAGSFREDLYYRLNIIRIELPPLRQREGDLPLLIDHFVDRHGKLLGMEQGIALSPEVLQLLLSYSWPGNVRQLSNTILRLMMGEDFMQIQSELSDLDNTGKERASGETPFPYPGQSESAETNKPSITSLKEIKARAAEYVERKAILSALSMAFWNKREAARMLKISYKALFNKLNAFGIGREL